MGIKKIAMTLAAAGMAVGMCGVGVAQDTKSADKSFIKDATEGSQAEINLAKLALEKSKDPNVRKFAEKMITDHSKLIEDMRPFTAKYRVEASGTAVTEHVLYEDLKLKSGISFDRAYVEAMVKDHNEDLKSFIKEENSTSDPELKATVAKGEKVIFEHNKMIDEIAHMGGIETPPVPDGASGL